MNRRDLLKGLLGVMAIGLPLRAMSSQRQKSVEWLVGRINEACEPIGGSLKAWEEVESYRYTHKTYAISTYGDEDLVELMWNELRGVILRNKADKPKVVWRKSPEFRKEGGKTILSMRLSIGKDGDGSYSFIEKPEWMAPVLV